jgi:hypothetical protein
MQKKIKVSDKEKTFAIWVNHRSSLNSAYVSQKPQLLYNELISKEKQIFSRWDCIDFRETKVILLKLLVHQFNWRWYD